MTSIEAFVSQLEQELLAIEQGDNSHLEQCKLCMDCIQQTLIALNEHVTLHPLGSVEEKIQLHKSILPKVNAHLIYFIKVFEIETALPKNALFARKKYYHRQLRTINRFFDYNKKLYQYYKSGDTRLDAQLFSDAPLQLELALEEYAFVPGHSFSSCQSSRLARIIAYERVQSYIHIALAELNDSRPSPVYSGSTDNSVRWTEQKASLIELAYALQSRGCINNGRLTIKEVVQLLEQVFQIDLGNFYRVFIGQRIRKNRTVFLDTLKECLTKKMDEEDENPRM